MCLVISNWSIKIGRLQGDSKISPKFFELLVVGCHDQEEPRFRELVQNPNRFGPKHRSGCDTALGLNQNIEAGKMRSKAIPNTFQVLI